MDAVRLSDPGTPARRPGWAPGAAGLALILLGGAVVAGWLTGRMALVQLRPQFAAMQVNTAVCFVLSGAALLSLALGGRRIAIALGALTAALAGLTFAEYLFGLDFRIDGLILPGLVSGAEGSSHRMAADTALALLAAGLSLVGFSRLPAVSGFLAALVLTVGSAWALGYAFGIPAVLASGPASIQMAFHTALGIVLLGSTLLGLSLERQHSAEQPLPWLALIVGAGLTLATLVLWRALETRALGAAAGGSRSALSEVILGAGLTIALLLTLTLHYGELAARRAEGFEREVRRRTAELEDALARLRAENRERHWTEVTLRRTLEVGRLVSAELDPDRAVQAVTDAATELTGAAFGAFFYHPGDPVGGGRMRWALAGAPRESFEDFPLPGDRSLLGLTFRGEGPIRLDDVTRDPRFGHNPPYNGLPDGHLPVVSYLAVPVVSRSGQPLGGMFFGHPQPAIFTAREEEIVVGLAAQAAIAVDNARLYQEERRSRAEAQAANAAKDRFLIVMGHELRNPLGSITSALEVLGSGGEDPKRDAQMRQIARRQVGHLARLVEDLLDISRIEQGKVALRRGRLDLAELLRETVESHREETERAGLALTLELPDEPPWVDADRTRLVQVVENLLSNSLKFTDEGGAILCALERRGGEAVVRIRDSGCGLEPDQLERIFEPFAQLEEAQRRMSGGLGLGLPIVKGLVEAHRGRLEAESDGPGQGTEVRAWLPLAAPPAAGEGAKRQRRIRGKPLRVLVIDDHRDSADGLVELLRVFGHEVAAAYDAGGGIEAAAASAPDVVISDLGLPGLDGYEVAKTLRAAPATRRSFLVALSGYGDSVTVERAREVGFDHHLTKPVDPERLRGLLADLSHRPPPPHAQSL